MKIIKEATINTGSMSFDTIDELDAFIKAIPSMAPVIEKTSAGFRKGQILQRESTQLSPNTFHTKMTYASQSDSDDIESLIDVNTVIQAASALGWTVDRSISYVYD